MSTDSAAKSDKDVVVRRRSTKTPFLEKGENSLEDVSHLIPSVRILRVEPIHSRNVKQASITFTFTIVGVGNEDRS